MKYVVLFIIILFSLSAIDDLAASEFNAEACLEVFAKNGGEISQFKVEVEPITNMGLPAMKLKFHKDSMERLLVGVCTLRKGQVLMRYYSESK